MKNNTLRLILIALAISCTLTTDSTQQQEEENNKYKNICYRGKSPVLWNNKRKLEEFAKGPCSPTVLVAGIGASDLMVSIDCPTLFSSDPSVFHTCGWTGCGENDTKPEPEY